MTRLQEPLNYSPAPTASLTFILYTAAQRYLSKPFPGHTCRMTRKLLCNQHPHYLSPVWGVSFLYKIPRLRHSVIATENKLRHYLKKMCTALPDTVLYVLLAPTLLVLWVSIFLPGGQPPPSTLLVPHLSGLFKHEPHGSLAFSLWLPQCPVSLLSHIKCLVNPCELPGF